VRVLLTGASGFVGGACASHLARRGLEVVGLSRRRPGNSALAEELQADLGSPGAAEAIAAATAPCEAIVHAAASVEIGSDPVELILANCLGTQQALALGRAWGVRQFVFLSSVPVVGRPTGSPILESHQVAPETPYHATKAFGELLVATEAAAGHAGVSLRLSAPVGPGMPDDRILPVFVRRAVRDESLRVHGRGTRRQNYVDVRDVAAAVEGALERDVTGVFNVAGQDAISNRELAQLCVRELDSHSAVELTGDDPEEGLAWEISIEKAARELGYVPHQSIEDSIHDIAAAIRED